MKSNIQFNNINKAIYQYLNNNLNFVVEEHVDDDTPKPYIVLGTLQSNREHARGLEGLDVTQELEIFSNFNGKDEVIEIVDAIRNLVAEQEFMVENANVHNQYVDNILIQRYAVRDYGGNLNFNINIKDF